jgi:hypothetical protein
MENTEKNEEILGTIFDDIHFTSQTDLNLLIDGMSQEQASIFIKKSLECAYRRGVFTLQESEIVSKSLRYI